jgi:predicted amidohydrolase YtcJ
LANPDLILYNGRIYPQADGVSRAEAVAIWNGLVTDVGTDERVLKLKARSVKMVDLKGRTVLPGFIDSHIHLLNYGMMLRTVKLYNARSTDDIKRAVVKGAGKSPNDWILGRGWDQEKLRERRYLGKTDLDDITQNPVFLRRVCGHIAVANSAALKIAGISRETKDPEAGEIVRDPLDGEPTGLLKENAVGLVERKILYNDKTVEAALISASRRLLRMGLTSLHCIINNVQELRILKRLSGEGRVKQSIYAIIPLDCFDEAVRAGFSTERKKNGFRIGGVKIFMDGSLGARTAALNEPYSDDADNVGMLTFSEERLENLVVRAEDAGFQLCMHAIGDRALATILKVLETKSRASARKTLRHRVEHSSIAPPALLVRMRKLGLIASVQPRFIYSDSWALERLGQRRVQYLYPFRSMLRRGILLAAGSDGPVEDPNPMEGVWSAVVRPGLSADESLTLGESFAAYTTGSAYASHSESSLGTIEPGKKADFVVLDRDPHAARPEELRSVRVLQTFIDGELVHGS